LLDVIATTCLKSNDLRRCRYARHSSVLSLSQAAMLMKVVVNNSRSTVQLIEIELSKAYLYRAFRCDDSDSDSIYCLANVYLAVLYYATGHYQTAIDHCTLVTRSQDHSQCSSRVVQGELLPKIGDDIDNVLGLAVLYEHVRTAALNQRQQTQYVSVFTPELFARYLCIRCLSVTQCQGTETWQCRQLILTPSSAEIQRYEKCFYESSETFIADVLAFKSHRGERYPGNFRKLMFIKGQTVPLPLGQLDTSELVELLKQSAVEHLTTSRQLEAHKFGSVRTRIVTTDYEALYAYKCGEYQRCFQLSTDSIRMLIGRPMSLSHVSTHPEFLQLMDDDIVSLIGLMLLVNPSCIYRGPSQLILSVYLMTQCQMKLHHSISSLAQAENYVLGARQTIALEAKSAVQLMKNFAIEYHSAVGYEFPYIHIFNQLLLKLTEQKIQRYKGLLLDRC